MDFLANFLAQALATLLGAWVAFGLERRRQARAEERAQRHEETEVQSLQANALRRVLFLLLSQREFLHNLKRQVLDPLREHSLREYALRPQTAAFPTGAVDLGELAFLLERDGAELLHRIVNADHRFRQVLTVLQERNEAHRAMQAALEPLNGSFELTSANIRQAMGPALDSRLRNLTDGLYSEVGVAWSTGEAADNLARDYARRVFPAERFFTFEFLPEPNNGPES